MPKENTDRPKPMTRVGSEWTPQQIIEDILSRAYRGEMTPDEAEAEARKWGFGPLAVQPPPEKHNPLKKAAWTFPMTLAWIVTGDAETVMWHDDLFRMDVLEWLRRGNGYDLIQPCPMTMVIAELGLKDDCSIHIERSERDRLVSVAKADLLSRLAAGQFAATGVRGFDEQVQLIPAHEWPHLGLFQTLNADYLAFEHCPYEVAYSSIKLPAAQILKNWPERQKNTARAASERSRWLANEIAKSPDTQKIRKVSFIEDCKNKKHGLSERTAIRVWNECTKAYPAWRKQGRPSKGSPTSA